MAAACSLLRLLLRLLLLLLLLLVVVVAAVGHLPDNHDIVVRLLRSPRPAASRRQHHAGPPLRARRLGAPLPASATLLVPLPHLRRDAVTAVLLCARRRCCPCCSHGPRASLHGGCRLPAPLGAMSPAPRPGTASAAPLSQDIRACAAQALPAAGQLRGSLLQLLCSCRRLLLIHCRPHPLCRLPP